MKTLLPLYLIILTGLISCGKDDDSPPAMPPTQIDLKVTGENNEALSGVTVHLYANHLDWTLEQNAVQTATTAGNGQARFTFLNLPEYFISASSGELSNWENSFKISGLQEGKAHTATIPLGNYQSYRLATAQGKSWRVQSCKINGVDVTSDSAFLCITDNSWVFFKGDRNGRFERRENSQRCDPSAPAVESGSWQLNPDGSTLTVPENGEIVIYNLLHLSANTLRIERNYGADTLAFTLVKP